MYELLTTPVSRVGTPPAPAEPHARTTKPSPLGAQYVEVVLDNSDGRMAVDSDEVALRRTVGLKKDEFSLNRKRVKKQDVTNLLESAGFSKANPYYWRGIHRNSAIPDGASISGRRGAVAPSPPTLPIGGSYFRPIGPYIRPSTSCNKAR